MNTLRKILTTLLVCLAVAVAAAFGSGVTSATAAAVPTPKPQPVRDQGRYDAGKAVYLANYCGSCHTLAAAGARGVFGPTHEHLARTATRRIADPKYKGKARTPAEYIHESIVAPNAYLAGGALLRQSMPPYTQLPEADLDALVYFLAQQQ